VEVPCLAEGNPSPSYTEYFADNATYNPKDFRWRYRMNKEFFMMILVFLREYSKYIVLKDNCCSRAGFSPIQKCTASMRILAYGVSYDSKR
jgi:hypothetical protein